MTIAKARLRLRVQYGDGFAIGSGKADILQAVAESGSISAGARSLEMSYRRAWLLIDAMNQCFREPVVDTATGGKGGGGAQIGPAAWPPARGPGRGIAEIVRRRRRSG